MKYILDFDIFNKGKDVVISLNQAIKILVANGYIENKKALKSKIDKGILHLDEDTAIYRGEEDERQK